MRWWQSRSGELPATAPADGLRLYVIGDIHGRLDMLDELHELILDDVGRSMADDYQIVYLGDYIDRGPSSADVIERLLARPLGPLPVIYLKGNHEAMLLKFLDNPESGPSWFSAGGSATVASYGLGWKSGGGLSLLAEELAGCLPEAHKNFLASLSMQFQSGDIFCVHAGVRPGVPLADQKEVDLLWMRQPFLKSTAYHGALIVHGHTPTPVPDVRSNRIGIDTGAYYSGNLTCLVLEGTERRFLTTGGDEGGI